MTENPRDLLLGMAEQAYQRWSVADQWVDRLEQQLKQYQEERETREADYRALGVLLARHGISLNALQFIQAERNRGQPGPIGEVPPEELVGELGVPANALARTPQDVQWLIDTDPIDF